MNANMTIVKIIKELHVTQADRIVLTNQLESMTLMCNHMADELAKIEGVDPESIIEEYTYKAYEQIKAKEK